MSGDVTLAGLLASSTVVVKSVLLNNRVRMGGARLLAVTFIPFHT